MISFGLDYLYECFAFLFCAPEGLSVVAIDILNFMWVGSFDVGIKIVFLVSFYVLQKDKHTLINQINDVLLTDSDNYYSTKSGTYDDLFDNTIPLHCHVNYCIIFYNNQPINNIAA